MADEKIRKALEDHLAALDPAFPTVWQNRPTPAGFDSARPHQKAFLLRAPNASQGLRERTTLHSGTFQINLCYPSGKGVAEIEARGVALQEHFRGQVLTLDGVKVQIRGKPSIADPVSISPYVVPVSIRYQSIN